MGSFDSVIGVLCGETGQALTGKCQTTGVLFVFATALFSTSNCSNLHQAFKIAKKNPPNLSLVLSFVNLEGQKLPCSLPDRNMRRVSVVEVVGNNAGNSSLHVNENWVGLLETGKEMKNCYSELVLELMAGFDNDFH